MKRNLAVTAALAAVLLAMAACAAATAASPSAISISCDDFQKQANATRDVHMPVGSTLVVTLCSNPSTGFAWEEAKIADAAVLQQSSHEAQPAATAMPGAPGSEQWTFKALKKGTTTVAFAYSRPWEGGEKGVWTLDLTVVVE